MEFSYRLVRDAKGWIAECVEIEALGEGSTPERAVDALRRALEERMRRPDAVAPPPAPARAPIELRPDDAQRRR